MFRERTVRDRFDATLNEAIEGGPSVLFDAVP